ncbi:hypothetical protein KW507_16055 [Vibrio fluvialis]|nr:hypothetical protein [Vibrio fluvialis]
MKSFQNQTSGKPITVHTFSRHTSVMVVLCVVCLTPLVATYKIELMLEWYLSGLIVAFSVISAPHWMKLHLFRRHFYWPDAMSEQQKMLLANGQLELAQQTSAKEGLSTKLKPYLVKISLLLSVGMILDSILSFEPTTGLILGLLNLAVITHYMFLTLFLIPNPITKWLNKL